MEIDIVTIFILESFRIKPWLRVMQSGTLSAVRAD